MGRDRSRSPYDNGHHSRSHSPERDILRDGWRAVRDDPHDFDSWCRLLQIVEQLDQTKPSREAYDEFLKRYPFCYGYWRKFAEFEKRHKHYERCLNVYEAGLQAIPLSVDLWLAYISYVKEIAEGQRQATVKIRDTYMRALSSCGLDFRSDKLWEEYIEWEIQKKEYEKAAALFDVILSTPTMGYAGHFERYKNFVNNMEPDKILSAEEYDEITDIVYKKIKHELDGPMFFMEEYEEEVPSEEYNNVEFQKRMVCQRKHTDLALREYREEIYDRRNKKFIENEREVAMRWGFESQIKRPYFHVKSLDRAQLKNWYDYLEFEIGEKKRKRIITLFERCMIACAMYDEMWIKYAVYLDSINDVENARDVFKRAIDPHCSRKPGIHLAFSLFEEKYGEYEAAKSILADYGRRHPNYVAVDLRKLALDRRENQRNKETDFSSIVSKYEKLIYDDNQSRRVSSFYAIKLARFHLKIRHDRRLAEKIIRDAIARDKKNCQLYLQLVDIAYSSSQMRESDVLEALDFAIDSPLSPEERFQFSQRKLDFLEELSSNVAKLLEHYSEHMKLEKELEAPPTTSLLGKRLTAKDDPLDPKKLKPDFSMPPPPLPMQTNMLSGVLSVGGVMPAQGYAGYGTVPQVYNTSVPPPIIPNLQNPPPTTINQTYYYGGQPETNMIPVQSNVNIPLA